MDSVRGEMEVAIQREAGFLRGIEQAELPERMGAGQGGVTAEVNLDCRCEPAQPYRLGRYDL